MSAQNLVTLEATREIISFANIFVKPTTASKSGEKIRFSKTFLNFQLKHTKRFVTPYCVLAYTKMGKISAQPQTLNM